MLDEESRVFIAENRMIQLNVAESKVLGYLIENKHRCVSAKELAEMLGYSPYSVRGTIYVLRDKLGRCLEIKKQGNNIGYKLRYIGDTNDNKARVND